MLNSAKTSGLNLNDFIAWKCSSQQLNWQKNHDTVRLTPNQFAPWYTLRNHTLLPRTILSFKNCSFAKLHIFFVYQFLWWEVNLRRIERKFKRWKSSNNNMANLNKWLITCSWPIGLRKSKIWRSLKKILNETKRYNFSWRTSKTKTLKNFLLNYAN